uniref:hypothetical protein n=1 Tax=Alistipes sp. TaxID=1872444 RepID=UPI00405770E2
MKKLLFTLLGLLCSLSALSQISYFDYTDGREFTYFGSTYRVDGIPDDILRNIYDSGKPIHINLASVENIYFREWGEYTDGSFVQDPEEVQGIIKYAPNDRYILYHAMRNVFTLEELENNPDTMLIIHFAIDDQGNILETSVGFPIKSSYVIQPQQIAALETMIRKNLTFVLDQEKAAKFNYFQGETWLFFSHFLEAPTLPEGISYFGEFDPFTKPLYTINLVEEFSGPTIIRSDGAPVYDRIGGTLLP